jgi:cytochrome P450
MNTAELLEPGIDFAYAELPDLHAVLDRLRARGPVVRVTYHGAPCWLITRYAELRRAFSDEEHFASEAAYRIHSEPSMGRTMQTMSGEQHRVNRALVSNAFFPRQVRRYVEPVIEAEAARWLDKIRDRDEVDMVQAFSRPYPFSVITRLLGIPVHDDAKFLEWALKLIDYPWDPEGAMRAKAEFDAYMIPLISARRTTPGEDVVSQLATAELEGAQLTDEEILSFCRLLFPAGSDTTYKNLGSLLYAVLANPGLRERAMAGDAEREALVQEGLRWEPPTALLPRMCSKDTSLGGQDICKGDWILFGITAANNDPEVFESPRRFDPNRSSKHLAFGHGEHFCLGSHLARRELEGALKLVFESFPRMSLIAERPVEIVSAVLRGPRELWVRPHGQAGHRR